ncbi:MAG TPA: membrane protein insertion efficiency factor YidD [Aquella sp.]|nr:membrane protein insertion efficiency factor YidD [Aquella sp.]
MLTKLFLFPIRFYQLCISPFLPRSCRYYPGVIKSLGNATMSIVD